MRLYHGSKSGLVGAIAPTSRDCCDFGRGFYMGDDPRQPLTLICRYEQAAFYDLDVDLSGLKVLDLETDLTWALVVAFNRGKMESLRGSRLHEDLDELQKGKDVIAGLIANDRMFYMLDAFFRGDITDRALVAALSALKLGRQYVAKTPEACARIQIVSCHRLEQVERDQLAQVNEVQRRDGISLAERIRREHRRDNGLYFDEILERFREKGLPAC